MYLKTVEHLLRLFSLLEAGQVEISPFKMGQYLCMEKSLHAKVFFHKKNEMSKKERRVEKESQIR